jgi:hypothetical protein
MLFGAGEEGCMCRLGPRRRVLLHKPLRFLAQKLDCGDRSKGRGG